MKENSWRVQIEFVRVNRVPETINIKRDILIFYLFLSFTYLCEMRQRVANEVKTGTNEFFIFFIIRL